MIGIEEDEHEDVPIYKGILYLVVGMYYGSRRDVTGCEGDERTAYEPD